MKKYLLFATLVATALASCTNDDFVGDPSPDTSQNPSNVINFGFNMQGVTRADIAGSAAADLLGNNFYVMGTKGDEATTSPTPTLVFDNYLVHYGANTAGTTESNTANWEYVGFDQTIPSVADRVKLSSTTGAQTIKFWDYSVAQYDFWAFSTGTKKAVAKTALTGDDKVADDEIGVTASAYGTSLANSGVAYTFYVPTVEAVQNAYITDITEVKKVDGGYGKEVQLRFKSLGSKIRIALYETVPGYSVKNVKFYNVDGTNTDLSTDANKQDNACLISADANGLPTKGTIQVYFPHVGNGKASEQDYDKAAATVTPVTTSSAKTQGFGALTSQLVAKERAEAGDDNVFVGRTLPTASFAGSSDASFYQTVFPVSTPSALTLRVDYTLVPIDGAAETITVYGAKAVVPATYTKWLPNYAYTYIFKISDNTNGWTSTVTTDPAGLFPITFDAVVAEATDATAEQKTITTVATPSITTYQQNHDITKDEYSIATGKDIYVQVMNNSTTTPALVTTLSAANSILYAVSNSNATEAEVMDALQSRTTALSEDNVTGRNTLILTKNSNIHNDVTSIVNGADNNPISVTAGEAAQIDISGLSTATYAYVYDYTSGEKTTVTEYQPILVTTGTAIGTSGKKYASIAIASLGSTETADNEAVDKDYIYFSKTTNGTGTTTYSYVSVTGKTNLPAGLIKVAKSSLTTNVDGNTVAVADTFYFDIYTTNSGKYAVKVIKIVA